MSKGSDAAGFLPLSTIFGDVGTEMAVQGTQVAKLSELYSFEDHPYPVKDDLSMWELMDSIKESGVIYPALVRPRSAGGYEIIAGHRRKRACELAGMETMPIVERVMDDFTATVLMVHSNCQREDVPISSKAFAYSKLLNAIKHQGKRNDLFLVQDGSHSSAADIVAREVNESRNQIKRYVRLTKLTPPFLELIDNKKLPFIAGVELSYLDHDAQEVLLRIMTAYAVRILVVQATLIKELFQKGEYSEQKVISLLVKQSNAPVKLSIPSTKLKQYFPASYSKEQMQEVVYELLGKWAAEQADKIAAVS